MLKSIGDKLLHYVKFAIGIKTIAYLTTNKTLRTIMEGLRNLVIILIIASMFFGCCFASWYWNIPGDIWSGADYSSNVAVDDKARNSNYDTEFVDCISSELFTSAQCDWIVKYVNAKN